MSAYVIVHGTPIDPEQLGAYSKAAAPTIAAHGGAIVAKGAPTVLTGQSDHAMAALIEFPDADAARAWYDSDAYQALIPMRERGLRCDFVLCG